MAYASVGGCCRRLALSRMSLGALRPATAAFSHSSSTTTSGLHRVGVGKRLRPGHVLAARFSKSSKEQPERVAIAKIRNIGIMAHIDAGKTTLSERMLLFSGVTRHAGNVDDGNTVMDYLEEERERGITIVSAATAFNWRDHRVNLIDTPGHVDFTLEVERALRVLDGCVAVLDGVAGVQAQTATVWKQADKYGVPRIAFVNKLDREGASVDATLNSMRAKLGANPVLLQIPVGSGRQFEGVVDLLAMQKLVWRDETEGHEWDTTDVTEDSDPDLFHAAATARTAIIEALADVDDKIADTLLAQEEIGHDSLSADTIRAALRRATLANTIVPVFCGAARRSKGAQPVMDGVVDYLPSPLDRPPVEMHIDRLNKHKTLSVNPSNDDPFTALAFKVVHDTHRGALVFLRVYSGVLHPRTLIRNSTKDEKERVLNLLEIRADRTVDVSIAGPGDIVAAVGLKQVATGDTIVLDKDKHMRHARLAGIDVPEPVFSCSIECASSRDEADFVQALDWLQREDPSVRVTQDEQTGQLILNGMGELHLDIVHSRLKSHYNVETFAGPVQVAYRERPKTNVTVEHSLHRHFSGEAQDVSVELSVEVAPGLGSAICGFERDRDEDAGWSPLDDDTLSQAARYGVLTACARGPLLSYPISDTRVAVRHLKCQPNTTPGAVSACLAEAVKHALNLAGVQLLEPVMNLEVTVQEVHLGEVLNDLSSIRHASVKDIGESEGLRVIQAEVPLAHMVGYASALRGITSGSGSFHMQFGRYEEVNSTDAEALLTGVRHH